MEATPSNINLLIDVAHLKVSAHSMDFRNLISSISPLDKSISCDNNAVADQNKPFDKNSWFGHILRPVLIIILEVYSMSDKLLSSQHQMASEMLGVA